MSLKKYILPFLLLVITWIFFPLVARADSTNNAYYLGSVQVKKDDGYGEDKEMKSSDVHYGWELGQFKISGFTRNTKDSSGKPVFLKSVGDKVQLSFELSQDINLLNNNKALVISEDDNGYDELFGITKDEKMNFGEGTLLVKYTDYQNKTSYIEPYINYLKGVNKGANTEIQFYEEGDYEIALDYEIQKKRWKIIPDSHYNYQIKIEFAVRNGNCMVYPFDVETGSELVNTSFTKNGFYLDLAKSRYLTIDVKKQNYIESDGTLTEDTRFNKAASDGERFTDTGVYVITVKNPYTKAETEKKIYVGDNPILKAYVTTGKDLDYIKEMLKEGATIEEDGTIVLSTNETIAPAEYEEQNEKPLANQPIVVTDEPEESILVNDKKSGKWIVICAIILIIIGYVIVRVIRHKKNKSNYRDEEDLENINYEKVDIINKEDKK